MSGFYILAKPVEPLCAILACAPYSDIRECDDVRVKWQIRFLAGNNEKERHIA